MKAIVCGRYGAVSTAGLLLFPMDVRGTLQSQRDTLHIIDTIVMWFSSWR
jgi:hypothetical protein